MMAVTPESPSEAAGVATAGGTWGTPDPLVIDEVSGITPAWLDSVLGTAGTPAAVKTIDVAPVGTGQMALTVRLDIEHMDATRRTLVAKVARLDTANELSRMAYAKEVAFYREMAHRLSIRTPVCHYAAIDDDSPAFVLVLEDMAETEQGDQVAGCSPDQARSALVNLAGLHGPTWCDPDLAEMGWLRAGEEIGVELLQPFLAGAADAFAARFADVLGAEDHQVLDTAREHLAAWLLTKTERFAVIHGDYRLDNLLFPNGDPEKVAAVDWQTASVGLAGRDVGFFLSTCLDIDARRRHEDKLLRTYHAALTRHGVAGYPFTQCVEDYRIGLLQSPFIILLGRATAAETARGDEMFLAMWQRTVAAIHDAGTLDLL